MSEKIFSLKGKTLVVIDWANVYGWSKKLKWEIDIEKLFDYLNTYSEIYDIRFYFGVEKANEKSEKFQQKVKNIGYKLISKEVKWVPIFLSIAHFRANNGKIKSIVDFFGKSKSRNFLAEINKPFGGKFYRRKCDFDCEIVMDVMRDINNFDGMILFSGDGDYKSIVEYLLDNKKQAIVVHPYGLRGREYNELLNRNASKPYLCAVEKLTPFLK